MDEKELKEKFEEIYSKKIMTKLAPLERERLTQAETYKLCITLSIIFFVAVFVVILIMKFSKTTPVLIFTLIGCFALCIVFMIVASNIQKKFINEVKAKLLTDLLLLFGSFSIFKNDIITFKEIKNTGLFPNVDGKRDDDRIAGSYKGMNVFMVETELTRSEQSRDIKGNAYNETVTVFRGLIIKTVLNKKYKGKTIIKQKALSAEDRKKAFKSELEHEYGGKTADTVGNSPIINSIAGVISAKENSPLKNIGFNKNGITFNTTKMTEFRPPKGLEEVILEDTEFNKTYAVFSNDQVESRYLITPAFMERLKKIRDVMSAYDVHCVFEDNHITLFLETGRDFFEVGDINTTLCNKKNYEKVFMQLVSIFNLIHYFKLDKKLGL